MADMTRESMADYISGETAAILNAAANLQRLVDNPHLPWNSAKEVGSGERLALMAIIDALKVATTNAPKLVWLLRLPQ